MSRPTRPRRSRLVDLRRAEQRTGKKKPPSATPLTMPIRDAATMIGCTWRTLLKMLEDHQGEHCIVRIGNRRAVDRKRFARWCRGQRISMEVA